jgi:hypothetical protein
MMMWLVEWNNTWFKAWSDWVNESIDDTNGYVITNEFAL